MPVRAVDDKSSDTLVVVSGEGFWTGSSTLPHLHHFAAACQCRYRSISAVAEETKGGTPGGAGLGRESASFDLVASGLP